MNALSRLLAGLLLVAVVVPSASAQSTEADVYVGQALLEFDDRQYDAALANLRRALEIEADHVAALYYTGLVHLAQRRPAEAVDFFERARAKAPTDPAVALQLGLAYFATERYDGAAPLLEEVFRSQPALDGLGSYVGFMRYRAKDYRGALRAFRAGRATDPELQQLARLYTGLSLAALGLPSEAAAEVEQALRLAPGSPLTGPVERLRDAVIATRRTERRLAAEVRVGVFFDDNVRVLPDPDHGPDDDPDPAVSFIRRQSRKSRDSVGELFGARVEYSWLRTPDWDSTVGYSFFASYYNDVPSFNITDHLGTVSLQHKNTIRTMPVQAGLQYAFDILFLDEDEFLRRNTASAFAALSESERHLTHLLGRYQHKEFDELEPTPLRESRDADNWMTGLQHFFRFAEDRHFIKAGYQFDYEDTEGRNYVYRGHRIVLGAQYTLPWWDVRLRYDFDVHLRGYIFRNSLLPTHDPGRRRRYDKELTHVVRAEVPLSWNLTLAAEYLKVDNRSNLQVFDYTRNVTSLILSWSR